MKHPDLKEEEELYRNGHKVIVGIDEAGRGPLAGPVVACALTFYRSEIKNYSKIRDSKQLSFKNRELIYEELKNDSNVVWGIGKVSEKIIDKINILEATKLAMIKAVKDLKKKTGTISYMLVDGNFGIDLDIPQKSIIKGDQKVLSIAAASIMAKVTRDRMMLGYHKKYPEYGFNIHKGYPTTFHRKKIKECGFCAIHRKSFRCS